MKKRNPRTLLPCLAIVFGLVAAACGGGTDVSAPEIDTAAEASQTEAVGDAPADAGIYSGDFVALDGTAIDFASFEGQDTVLWFWAPW